MRFDMVAFDLDGVIVAERSSWEWVHMHFGLDNTQSLKAFCDGKIDDLEFMRTDIAMWHRIKPDVSLADIKNILMDAKINSGSVETIQALKKKGIKTCIVSGGIDLLADQIGEMCGVDRVMSNGLTADSNGRLLGDGILRVELRDKAKALSTVLDEFGIVPERCAAIGNSWVDVSMFKIASYGIAFNPIDSVTIKEADVVVESDDLRDVLEHLE
ncbi:MAG: HAD family phosphatase [Candidatus Thermoplasmatota archaeon]|nr:HAD-IB family phosphatase [Euryarchaeota archaeon]MBU4032593.1 HAD family phosphatase [Candidatus Thermoplasmatota archaeon]MBU4070654.1 HAD family phosphatase [Candidatus Thermoplasmatota archaeon]MBU4145096.1 HAD family phosphatase [Candidatus Thermoplasmatota archaeon]MBU4592229.1 HAD family phosphatase [Candidatus Thermoplasmatota archaeon]